MINPQDTTKIAYNLEEIVETLVSEKIVKLLTESERAYICSLMYKWTQGINVKEEIIYLLEKGKSRLNKKEYHGTALYNKVNK